MKQNAAKLLSTLLVLCLVLAALPGTALAVDITYAVEGGNLYFNAATGTITRCDESVTRADIPNEIYGVAVTAIGGFSGCNSLTSVTIPNSVTTIGSWAFQYCESLTSITIPSGVTSIGRETFRSCSSLTSITIPNSVTSIGEQAFFECSSLTSITIPNSVTSIEGDTFYGCSSLTSITIPNSVTSIGEEAFYRCSSLTSVTIPNSVTTIDRSVFFGCSSLTSITIPNSVTSIGGFAFKDCSSLTSITIPNSVTSIGEYAFQNCRSLTSITIPVSVKGIGNKVFENCSSLTDVYYGGSVKDWGLINLGWDNDPLLTANIHYDSPLAKPAAPASPSVPQPAAPAKSVSVTVNGTAVQWPDAAPFIDEHGRTMVPLRAVADAIGLTVNWDANAREASFTDGGKTIIFPIGSTAARTGDGQTVTMNTAAVIVSGRTYAPVRYLAEFFGYGVDWDAASRNVIITKA